MTRSNPEGGAVPGTNVSTRLIPGSRCRPAFRKSKIDCRLGKPMATLCRTSNCPSVRLASSNGRDGSGVGKSIVRRKIEWVLHHRAADHDVRVDPQHIHEDG